MTCREFAEFMADYLSGALPAETRAAFDHHLAICPNCRTYLTSYSATSELGRRAFGQEDAEVPADVPDDLVNAIIASRKR